VRVPLGPIVGAEWRKLLSRGSARLGLALSVGIPLITVILLQGAETWQEQNLGTQQGAMNIGLHVDAAAALGWSLKARNFFILPLILLWLAAQTLGGEVKDGTLRPVLLRPVSRVQVLVGRTLALAGYAGLTLLVTAVTAAVLAIPLLGLDPDGDMTRVALAYLVGWGSDVALIGLGFAVSCYVPATAGTVVVTALVLLIDGLARAGLSGAAMFGASGTDTIARFLPGSALAAWEGFATVWDPVAFAGLGLWTVAAYGLAAWRLQRMDIP
jgi:ABC-type transport system involved in multi-copper enzyme maturation permease subunit